ncbi:MAG: tRNA (N(6)-L-threonylcarbamoyladenosine(37)-C(2))-methylthiotransferase MtaB [Bacteroidales bacterium]|nr:tRNA (N(6)-L-threonylcarbamoyladenosine(37)-C(2))-methylthiotransferase MtaB [Bacteroidales bacterium]
MKIALLTLGCKLNYAETSTYERGFKAAGLEVTDWRDTGADVYLVNTCSVTQHSDNKCRNIIRKCHRTSPDAAIVVTGCYAQLRRDEVEALEGVRLVFGADEKKLVVPRTLSLLGLQPEENAIPERAGADELSKGSVIPGATSVIPGADRESPLEAFSSGERTRSFLKVQDGCDNFCAYCTVPFARGHSRNIPICELVKQAEQIAGQGIKEIVLTGVNTGDFGRTTGESFLDLLKALNGVKGIERYRISSIEPNLITEEIVDWIASGTKFLPHFHIPLQVGCDRLLKAVGRKYDTALFASRIDYIRAKMGDKVFFGIDVIVGLPGETEEEFQQTYDFLENRIKPAFIHIFPYSRRPGTRAAVMPGQVQDSIKTERVKRLEALCEKLHSSFAESCKGMPEEVLWEGAEKGGKMSGYTGNYLRIERPFESDKIGKIEKIVI